MQDYVVFRLVAPMGSFGGLAGHERRGSGQWPGRSAILGLLGAALGVRRNDRDGQAALASWQTAVAVYHSGAPLQDFHTVQYVPSANIKRPVTRADALRALRKSDNAAITRRDYVMDCAFGVAVWGGSDPEALVAALQRPRFVPYMGRKSCPLSAPMVPHLTHAETVETAFSGVTLPEYYGALRPKRILSDAPSVGAVEETLWDDPLDREAWHFGPRTVHITAPQSKPNGAEEGQS